MAGKNIVRILLVAVLVITAHIIKPFSPGNVALHALSAARSLSFVMPESAVERIEHANFLAQTFGKRLLDENEATIWNSEDVLRSGLVAFAAPAPSIENAEIRDIRPADSDKKTLPKRSVRRIKREDNRETDSGCSKSNDVARLPEAPAFETVAFLHPMELPVYKPRVVRSRFAPVRSLNLTELSDCSFNEVRISKLIAVVEKAANLKVELMVMPKKPASIVSQCTETESEKKEREAIVETTSGPDEEEFFFEPNASGPLAMPQTEECLRIP